MANTTDRELIEMYQKCLEMVALENLRLEKEKQELVSQLQQVSSQKPIEDKDRHEYEKRIEILSQENQKKQQEAEAQIKERDEKIEALYKEVAFTADVTGENPASVISLRIPTNAKLNLKVLK